MSDIAKDLEELLTSRDFDPSTLDSRTGKPPVDPKTGEPDPERANVFQFDYESSNGKNYGTITILLGPENTLEVYASDTLGQTMEEEDKDEWFAFLKQLKEFAVRNFRSFSVENLSRMKYSLKGQSRIKESLFESYYGNKLVSYTGQPTEARLMIKHNRVIGENDRRYLYVESLFIETADGERFKLPFKRLSAGRAMLEHVRQGGKPYDIRGQHICEIVEELNVLTRFNRAQTGKIFEGETLELITETEKYYEQLQQNLKTLSNSKGYKKYFESWQPAEISDSNLLVDNLKQMFIEQSIDTRIESALPLLAKIKKGNGMKQIQVFESWADQLMEGDLVLPDTPEKQEELAKILAEPLPLGPDANSALEALTGVFEDSELTQALQDLARQDTDADARGPIIDILMNHKDDPSVKEIVDALSSSLETQSKEPEQLSEIAFLPLLALGGAGLGAWDAYQKYKAGDYKGAATSAALSALPGGYAAKKALSKVPSLAKAGLDVGKRFYQGAKAGVKGGEEASRVASGSAGLGRAGDIGLAAGQKVASTAGAAKRAAIKNRGKIGAAAGLGAGLAGDDIYQGAKDIVGKIYGDPFKDIGPEGGKTPVERIGMKDQPSTPRKPTVPDIPTVDDEPQKAPAATTPAPAATIPAPAATSAETTPAPTQTTPAPIQSATMPAASAEPAKKSTEWEPNAAQKAWLSGADPKDRYILSNMPPELGTKPEFPKFDPNYEKRTLKSTDPLNPRYDNVNEADVVMLEGKFKDLAIEFMNDLEFSGWSGKPLYKDEQWAMKAVNDTLHNIRYSKLDQEVKEQLRSYAMQKLGHWHDMDEGLSCNMTSEGQHCPKHGLSECYGEGVYENAMLTRMKKLAGLKDVDEADQQPGTLTTTGGAPVQAASGGVVTTPSAPTTPAPSTTPAAPAAQRYEKAAGQPSTPPTATTPGERAAAAVQPTGQGAPGTSITVTPPAAASSAATGQASKAVSDIAKASGIADPNKIQVGQKIKLPGGGEYTVAKGDTLSAIARRAASQGAAQPAAADAQKQPGPATQWARGMLAPFGGQLKTGTTQATPAQASATPAPAAPTSRRGELYRQSVQSQQNQATPAQASATPAPAAPTSRRGELYRQSVQSQQNQPVRETSELARLTKLAGLSKKS